MGTGEMDAKAQTRHEVDSECPSPSTPRVADLSPLEEIVNRHLSLQGLSGGTNHRIYQPQRLPRGREPDSSWANQNIPTPPGYSNWLKTGQKSFSGIFSTAPGRKLFPL